MSRRLAGALALAAACVGVAACGDDSPTSRFVPALDRQTPEEREASEKFAQAQTLLDAGSEREAESALRRVLELSPKHVRALTALGDLLLRHRRFDDATPVLRRLVELSADTANKKRLVESLNGQRDFVGAEAVARQWAKTSRDSAEAWYQFGCALHELGRLDDAAQALDTAATKQASRGDVRSRLGLVHLAQGKRDAAESDQRDALRRDPRCVEAWPRLGDAVAQAGPARYDEAVAAYRRALEAGAPGAGGIHARLYRLLRLVAARDPSKAREADAEWKTLLDVAGRDMTPSFGLPPAASTDDEAALRAAVVASPDDAKARGRYATCLHRRGDVAGALPEYAEAARTAPDDARIRAAFGAALLVSGDVAAATPHLAAAAKRDPSDETTARNLGWASLVAGSDADALAAFERALRLAKDDRLALRGRGLAKLHAGELDAGLRDVTDSGWGGR